MSGIFGIAGIEQKSLAPFDPNDPELPAIRKINAVLLDVRDDGRAAYRPNGDPSLAQDDD